MRLSRTPWTQFAHSEMSMGESVKDLEKRFGSLVVPSNARDLILTGSCLFSFPMSGLIFSPKECQNHAPTYNHEVPLPSRFSMFALRNMQAQPARPRPHPPKVPEFDARPQPNPTPKPIRAPIAPAAPQIPERPADKHDLSLSSLTDFLRLRGKQSATVEQPIANGSNVASKIAEFRKGSETPIIEDLPMPVPQYQNPGELKPVA